MMGQPQHFTCAVKKNKQSSILNENALHHRERDAGAAPASSG
jgi:hypothetical protein